MLFCFYPQTKQTCFYCPTPSKYPMYPIYLMYPLYLIHLMHLIHPMYPMYLIHPLSPLLLIYLLFPIYPFHLIHPMHLNYLLFTITTTAPNIRTMPMARLTVKGSLNTKMPMSTAVRGSKAPRMAVGVDPTYLAA